MPVTDVQQDLDNLTLTITADFAAPVARIWQVYADPRQLEKVWGPPTYPATVVDHEFKPGGRVTYFMTGPEGDKHAGYWEIKSFDERDGGTRATYVSTYESVEALEQVLKMGVVEGASAAIGQIDELIA